MSRRQPTNLFWRHSRQENRPLGRTHTIENASDLVDRLSGAEDGFLETGAVGTVDVEEDVGRSGLPSGAHRMNALPMR
jgi:hypothetical protein